MIRRGMLALPILGMLASGVGARNAAADVAVVAQYAHFEGFFRDGAQTFTARNCYVVTPGTTSVQACLATVEFSAAQNFCTVTPRTVSALLKVRWGAVSEVTIGVSVTGTVSQGGGTLSGVTVEPVPGLVGIFSGSVSIIDTCDGESRTAEEFDGSVDYVET